MFGVNSTIHTDTKTTGYISPERLSQLLNEIKNYNGGKIIQFNRVSEFDEPGKAKYIIVYNWESYWSSDDY